MTFFALSATFRDLILGHLERVNYSHRKPCTFMPVCSSHIVVSSLAVSGSHGNC